MCYLTELKESKCFQSYGVLRRRCACIADSLVNRLSLASRIMQGAMQATKPGWPRTDHNFALPKSSKVNRLHYGNGLWPQSRYRPAKVV